MSYAPTPLLTEEKRCTSCGETKSVSEFYRDKNRKDGLYPACKACHYVRTQAHRARTIERIRECERARYANGGRLRKKAEKRLRKYGLTAERYDNLLQQQGGVCAICRKPFKEDGSSGDWDLPSVDHCHETGRVRGILHRRCNLALELGLTEEDWARARLYLTQKGSEDA